MADDLSLNIPLNGDVSPIEAALNSMKDKVSNAMGQVKDAMGAVGIMAAGYLKSSIESAAKGEENFKNLTQTIKSTGEAAGFSADQIKAMSKELSSQTTFSSGEIMKGQNMLLTFTNIQGDVLKKASMAMLDLSQKYGTLPEQQAIALGKALNDPVKGVTALTRVGVTFTEQQKEQIKTMQEAGNVAGAQNIILKELNTEFGGQASAAVDTYNGQLKQVTNSFNSIKTIIGGVLLPYFKEIAEKVNTASQAFADFASKHKQLLAGILSVTAVLGTLIGGAGVLQKIFTILGPVVTGLGSLIGGLSLPIVGVIAAIAGLTLAYTKNFGGLKTFIDETIGKIIAIVKTFIDMWNNDGKNCCETMGVVFEKNTAAVTCAISGVVDSIKVFIAILTGNFKQASSILDGWSGDADKKTGDVVKFFARLALNIQKVVNDVVNIIKSNWPKIEAVFKEVLNILIQVVNWTIQHWPQIEKVIISVFNAIVQIWNSILKPVLALIIRTFNDLVSWVIQHWPQIKSVVEAVFKGIALLWDNVLKPVLKFVISVIAEVVKFISDNWPLIEKYICTPLTNAWKEIQVILNAIKAFWSVWGDAIKDLVKTAFNDVKISIMTIIKVIQDIIKAIMQAITGDWSGAWNSIVQAVKDIFGGVGQIVSNNLDGIKKIFVDIAKVAIDWGANMIEGFINGIKSKIQKVKDTASDVINAVKDFMGFHSPSKEGEGRYIVDWGANMINGFMQGIKSKLPDMQQLMSTAIQSPTLFSLNQGGISSPGSLSTHNTYNSTRVNNLLHADNINISSMSDWQKILEQEQFYLDKLNAARGVK